MPLRHSTTIRAAIKLRLQSRWAGTVLDRSSLLLLIGGLLLPNTLALAAGTVAGVPVRTSPIALYAALALLGGRIPGWTLALLGLLVLLVDVLHVVNRLFLVGLDALVGLISVDVLLNLIVTPIYAAGALAVAALGAAYAAFMLRAGPAMRCGNRPVFAAAAAALLVGDGLLNSSTAYEFGPLASIGKPFESGSVGSGFDALPDQARPPRRTLLVMVESLGVLRDPRERATLMAPFEEPSLRRLYTVATGTSAFFGATASGEMRELCGTYSPYWRAFADDTPACLPARFAALGYRTVSLHGFRADFYDRAEWYPRAGFQHSHFAEALAPRFARRCDGPFPGPCDTDVAEAVDAELRAEQPSFVYWLTLNSHVPVPRGGATPRQDCGHPGSPFADHEVCAMVEVWQDVFAAVARLALAYPGTEILLVGDHAPPLWRRAARDAFEPGRVPWIRLSPLPVASATAALP